MADEEWDSQFQSTRQSAFRESQPKLEYDVDVEIALERLLGRDQLEDVKREGYFAGAHAHSDVEGENGEEEQAGEEEQVDGSGDHDPKEDPNDEDHKDHSGDGHDKSKDQPDGHDGKDEIPKEGGVVLPLEKKPKPWELPDQDGRTEILVGVRYNKDFEQLFDDKMILKDRKPVRIVRVKAHFNHEFIVGVQFSYMTEKEELVDGIFHGDKKVIVNNLKKVQYEIQYREHIESITACFSRGLHWLELKTNEGRSLLLGEKSGANVKAVTQEKTIHRDKGEELTYVSGGFTGKDRRFTYLAFHLVSGWGKKDDFFKDMKDSTKDVKNKDTKDPVKDDKDAKDAPKDGKKDPATTNKDGKDQKDPVKDPKDTTKDAGKDNKDPKAPLKDAPKDTKPAADPKDPPKDPKDGKPVPGKDTKPAK